MIIDNLFKANGNIYSACLNLYEDDVDDARVSLYGFDIVIETDGEFPFAFFNADNQDFRFIFEEDTILFMYGSVSLRLQQPCDDKDIEDFKKAFLFVLNLRSGHYYETLDQFIDLYNMIHI